MKVLPIDQFVKMAARKMPIEFRALAVVACDYVQEAIEVALCSDHNANREVVVQARKNLELLYHEFLNQAKAKGFAPDRRLGVFELINHLA